MGLLNPGGPIAQFERNRCSISPVEVISLSGVRNFTHLECAGPKLAHYAGYIIANNILPWVEPGYREDYCQTMAFSAETEKYMGYLPL